MAQTLSTLSLISYILAAVFFLTGVVLFFVLRIPRVFNDYTGRTARKKIMKLRNTKESPEKSAASSAGSGKSKKKKPNMPAPAVRRQAGDRPDTGLIAENKAYRYASDETEMLEETTAELTEPQLAQPARPAGVKLKMLNEVMFIHTEEVIS